MRFLPSLLLMFCLGACAALPEPPRHDAPPGTVPTVANARGALPAQDAKALFARRWAGAGVELKALAAQEEAATGKPLIAGNKVDLLFDGPQTMQAMTQAVAAAHDSINLESYIFDDDAVGQRFADQLIARARAGVGVNVLVDGVGTLSVPSAFFDRMRAAGIRVLVFNPVAKFELNNRDHRKLLVVDGKVAFTGGINISSDYARSSLFRSHQGTPRHDLGWRDTHLRIEGPAVAALQWSFIDLWVRQDGGELAPRQYFPTLAPAGDKIVRVLATKPDQSYEIYQAMMVALREAKKTIHITAAYFVPDQSIIDALGDAARRGVDVQLILPGKSDHDMMYHAGRAYYGELFDKGIKIAQLRDSVLHAKSAVIDGAWSTVGSANIDRRSFQHNYELNVMVLDPAFGKAMEAAFAEDLRNSDTVTRAQWQHRPFADRLKEWSTRVFSYWL